jgi:hypothetical protein
MTSSDESKALVDYLATRDVACPNCGYNLRGLTGASCPECNQGLVLGVAMSEPRMGGLLGTLAAVFGMGVAGGVFVLLMLGFAMHYGSYPPGEIFIIPGIAAVVGTLGGLLLAGRSGRVWFRGLRRGAMLSFLIGSWAAVAGAALLFMAQILYGIG